MLQVMLNEVELGEKVTADEVRHKFKAEVEFIGDTARLPPHPQIVRCFKSFVGKPQGLPELDWQRHFSTRLTLFTVMEYIDGKTMMTEAAAPQVSDARFIHYSEQLLEALAHLRAHDILHRCRSAQPVLQS